jgi:hypothetical protein
MQPHMNDAVACQRDVIGVRINCPEVIADPMLEGIESAFVFHGAVSSCCRF